jgi:hypothetical protein
VSVFEAETVQVSASPYRAAFVLTVPGGLLSRVIAVPVISETRTAPFHPSSVSIHKKAPEAMPVASFTLNCV